MDHQKDFQRANIHEQDQDDWNQVHRQLQSVQKKSMSISNPDDEEEKEADAIARKVINGEEASVSGSSNGINRKGMGEAEASPQFQSQLESSKGSGQSLPENIQQEMGSQMGADFSGVKVHADNEAGMMSEGINAKAFTHGNDIFFNQGQYNTNSKQGKELLAHELVHTVQQSAVQRKSIQRDPKDDNGTITERITTLQVSGPIKHVNVTGKNGMLIDDDSPAVASTPQLLWSYTIPKADRPPEGLLTVTVTMTSGEVREFHPTYEKDTDLTIKITGNQKVDFSSGITAIDNWEQSSITFAAAFHDWVIANYSQYFGDTCSAPQISLGTALSAKFKEAGTSALVNKLLFTEVIKDRLQKLIEKKLLKIGVKAVIVEGGIIAGFTAGGTIACPGLGTAVGFIIGVILDVIVSLFISMFGNDEIKEAFNAGAETATLMTAEYIRKGSQNFQDQLANIVITASNARASMTATQDQTDIDKAKGWYEISKSELDDSKNNLTLKPEKLREELLATWVMENADDTDAKNTFAGDISSEQYEAAIKKLHEMNPTDYVNEKEVTNHPEMFVHQFTAELRRLGVDENDGKYIMDKVNAMRAQNKTAKEIQAAFDNDVYSFVIRPSEIVDPEKYIKQVNATCDTAHMTAQGMQKVRAKKDVYLTMGFDLDEDEGTVYVNYFDYSISFKNWDASQGGYSDYSWYEYL